MTDVHDMILEMRRDPARDFQTHHAARALAVTSSIFIRRFRGATGLSPMRFRATLRIERAKTLLLETDRSVTDISLDVGYSSFGTFVRTFTELVGVCPTRLRTLVEASTLDWDRVGAARLLPNETRDEVLSGVILPPPGEGLRTVAVGLFHQGVPAGLPIDGCAIRADGRFELRWPRDVGRVSLLAAAFHESADRRRLWMAHADDLLVFSRQLRRRLHFGADAGPVQVLLRAMTAHDPPVLAPLPLLLASGATQSGRS